MPVETVRFERSIHFNDCNTSWVNLNIVSLYKPVSLTKIKVLCCLNVDDLLSRTLLLTIVTVIYIDVIDWQRNARSPRKI